MKKVLFFFVLFLTPFCLVAPVYKREMRNFLSIFLGRGARHDKKYDDNYKKGKNPFCCPAAIMEKARKVGRGILFNLVQPPQPPGGGYRHTTKEGEKAKKYLLSSEQQSSEAQTRPI